AVVREGQLGHIIAAQLQDGEVDASMARILRPYPCPAIRRACEEVSDGNVLGWCDRYLRVLALGADRPRLLLRPEDVATDLAGGGRKGGCNPVRMEAHGRALQREGVWEACLDRLLRWSCPPCHRMLLPGQDSRTTGTLFRD